MRGPDCAAYEPRVAHDTNLLSILYLRERSELVDDDVDVARAAVIAPLGGGAHTIASAWEIATEMQLAGGGGEAPSSDEEGGATA